MYSREEAVMNRICPNVSEGGETSKKDPARAGSE